MARIKDASVDAVKAAADIVEVVSLRTSLRRVSGARFSGRCPFHEEKTPSFSVDPVGKLYYCFGCGKGGDVIRFVQESENLDFAGAIEWLGERFRVTLEFEESQREDEQRRRRDRLTKLLDQATAYFERILWDTEAGGPVRAYLAERGLGDEVSREFRLGLSRGTGLVAKARESGFSPDEIRAAGLANQRGNDYFPGGSSASRRGSFATTTRCAASTSTRPRATCSRRGTSSTGSISPGRRSRSRTARSSSRGIPT